MIQKEKLLGKKAIGIFFFCLLGFLWLMIGSGTVAKAEILLPPAIVVGDSEGIKVGEDGKYLMDLRDILPGESFEATISFLNVDEKEQPYELFFGIKPPVQIQGPINFGEAMTMSIEYEGKEIYNGKVSGIGNLDLQKEEYSLGVFNPGDSKSMKVSMKMGSEYTNKDYATKSITENVWQFRAIRNGDGTGGSGTEKPGGGATDGGSSKPTIHFPQTGEEWRDALIYSVVGMFFLVVVILLWHHRRQQKKAEKNKEEVEGPKS